MHSIKFMLNNMAAVLAALTFPHYLLPDHWASTTYFVALIQLSDSRHALLYWKREMCVTFCFIGSWNLIIIRWFAPRQDDCVFKPLRDYSQGWWFQILKWKVHLRGWAVAVLKYESGEYEANVSPTETSSFSQVWLVFCILRSRDREYSMPKEQRGCF